MLHPDEIIISKEWHQLNDAEKESLKELADSETSFNLLKKMLMVSFEQNEDVPIISQNIYKNLEAVLPARRMNQAKYWYAAAAALVIVLTASLFLVKKDAKNNYVKNNTMSSKTDSIIKRVELAIQQNADSSSFQKTVDTSADKLLVQSSNKNKPLAKQQPVFIIADTTLYNAYAFQTKVGSAPSLLNFITEAD
ncbi:MAG TPA: hypothetical protein PK504_10655 [Ferruginibacter sp.]|nr:hypothetical protein [Ferruginibacter sp.]HRE63582.1 hypothetical protein [Ferruginibacter sp.]